MQLSELLETLGYADSPNLLRAGTSEFQSAPALGHVFRHASSKRGLKGVYTLRPPSNTLNEPLVPVVYICEAEDEEEADRTHRLIWNQDVVPFVLVQTRDCIKLYSGFRYRKRRDTSEGLLRTIRTTNEILQLAESLSADAIDDGKVWRSWGKEVRTEGRIDRRLLESLRRLDQWLQNNGLDQDISHALIGKYVYLRYLKDRDILSKRKLDSWNISEQEVFGRQATLAGVERTIGWLDEWLNGSVFPIRFSGKKAPRQEHLRRVAATFMGDQPIDDGSWQLHLDFQAYDFSYIPIETLSIIYEQFLHAPIPGSNISRGQEAGAYYTPLPAVNFMLAEMEDRSPLRRGMRVLDPACGSGAFLVQCYRRLIEHEYPPDGPPPGPIKLRELLQESIFGIDSDPDACSVTELSLILTLLDYVDPPDLENDKRVKLPSLRNTNIFCENFFADDAEWHRLTARRGFNWVVGNPPWKKLNPKKLSKEDMPIWDWMDERSETNPIGGNQVAQAFTWVSGECLLPSGQAGLLVPAMTFFEDLSRGFRAAFLKAYQLQSVANFSNLAEVLFAGRSRIPAAAIFFRLIPKDAEPLDDHFITTYSPFVANQEATRPVTEQTRIKTWNLVLNASEVRDIPLVKVVTGSALPWKLASWGSNLDEKLLGRLLKQFPRLGQLEQDGLLIVSEGLQIRHGDTDSKEVEYVSELVDKLKLEVGELKEMRHFFAFPSSAFRPVRKEMAFVRRRGGVQLPLSVCRPPHVIVSAARNFAIYSDEYIVVPPRQIGIVSPRDDKNFLIALSLFLSSDFAFYHQFLTTTQFGVKRDVATLGALREIPVPIEALTKHSSTEWADLHTRLVSMTVNRFESDQAPLFTGMVGYIGDEASLLAELNELVSTALGLTDIERAIINDLVEIKFQLNDGKLGRYAIEHPSVADIGRYARQLKSELDAFIEGEIPGTHMVEVLIDNESALVAIELIRSRNLNGEIKIYQAGAAESAEFMKIRARLRLEYRQWVYFDRNLRIFEDGMTYVFKPLQRFHWTISQALCDANDIIAEAVHNQGKGA